MRWFYREWGSFDPAVQHLRSRGLEEPIKHAINSGKPFLGICLGLQILFEGSEEGTEPGLGIVAGTVRRFHWEPGITIPHMGWNELELTQPDSPLWQHIWQSRVYLSIPSMLTQLTPISGSNSNAWFSNGDSGDRSVTYGSQFHPEKSSTTGCKFCPTLCSS
jgi:glutamine amidotransferase